MAFIRFAPQEINRIILVSQTQTHQKTKRNLFFFTFNRNFFMFFLLVFFSSIFGVALRIQLSVLKYYNKSLAGLMIRYTFIVNGQSATKLVIE